MDLTRVSVKGRSFDVCLDHWREQLFPAGLARSELTLRAMDDEGAEFGELFVDGQGSSDPVILAHPDGGFLLGFDQRVLYFN